MASAYLIKNANNRSMQLRLPPDMVERIDDWAVGEKMPSRSEAIRTLIETGLDQKEAQNESGPAR